MILRLLTALTFTFVLGANPASAASGDQILNEKCASCHSFVRPDNSSHDRLKNRKGQDLFYAGSKYNQEWLVKWLQAPVRIKPTGNYNFTSARKVENSPSGHIKLSRQEAESATQAMMQYKAPADIVIPGIYEGGKAGMEGGLGYYKSHGCYACHMLKPGQGGKAGVELYTGGERMQPDYIASFIKHPKKFDKYMWMPKIFISNSTIQNITGFILSVSEQYKSGAL